MDAGIIVAVLGAAGAITVAAITAFYSISSNRKKQAAETEALTISTLRQSQDILKEMLSPLEMRIKELEAQIETLKFYTCKNAPSCLNRKKL